ncbi:MAG: InlB B-repeat-containing protein [Christensenellales bacterium]|jgi:uncharacterized repeat protein (TIGR02543 family)
MGETVARPADPVWDGYVFVGWYTDESYAELFDFDTEITEDLTLYAKMVRNSGIKIVI